MKVDQVTKRKMEILANESNAELNAETFTYLSCVCLVDEIINLMESSNCNVSDVQILMPLLEEKISKCLIKKEDRLSSTCEKTI